MMGRKQRAAGYALLAAALYAVSVPLSKQLMNQVAPTMMAAFLYLGAGLGLGMYGLVERRIGRGKRADPLTRKELPYTVAMVVLDIAAPILLMLGISMSNSASVSLLNNFEIVATSIIALVIFGEAISRRLWLAIALVTLASAILSFEGTQALAFSRGSLLVLGACLCWGFENNCTKMISNKSSVEIVVIKGTFSGLGSLVVALIAGERLPALGWIACVLALGFVAYGLSIHFYIMAQKDLGAAKTSAFYAVAPFLGVAFSMLLLNERPGVRFYVALCIMLISTCLMVKDTVDS
ncbi:MAG: DMT family transporter [Aristaeellaceae bacterium]